MKFGRDSIIAIVPAFRDLHDRLKLLATTKTTVPLTCICESMLPAMVIVISAAKVGLPARIWFKMVLIVAFDFLIGLVSVIGDNLDIVFTTNTRNVNLLESYLS